MAVAFEQEVVFPSHPFEAAYVFCAVMAYPEEGAGRIGGPGSEFANALVQFSLWATSKARGLPFVRNAKRDPSYVAPKKREFRGALDRGRRRIDRRLAAYDLFGSQILTAFFNVRQLGAKALREGRADEAFHMHPEGGPSPARAELWEKAVPSARKFIKGSASHWAEKFALNVTAKPSDPDQKAKDIKRRAFEPSIPVLHMAHALNECAQKYGPRIPRWGERDPVLAMILNAELWIWEALEVAETWRSIPHFPGIDYLDPNRMIRLLRS
ncbi:hypothetical protein [Sphingosinicella sp.]|uniref:hypothetical protein n=1 Tax=Sphingosinicella sp. TaxID=1917971 RepID=UPI004038059F